jgi:putative DNA primase/helicase
MANIFPDLEKNELKRTGKIKAIISNEGVEVQQKHKQGFTLYPFCKLVFSTNRFPRVFDESQGFFRRWIIIKWERSFEGDPDRIEYLRESLEGNQTEINKVFSSLVQLAKKIHKQGKFTHSKSWKVIQEEWNKNADPVDYFIRTCLVDSESNSSKRVIFQAYKQVMLDKGETPLGIGQFGKIFSEYYDDFVEKHDEFTRKVWCNVAVKVAIQTKLAVVDAT